MERPKRGCDLGTCMVECKRVFSAYSRDFKDCRVNKFFGVFEVFLGVFKKTKEKKDRVRGSADMESHCLFLVVCVSPKEEYRCSRLCLNSSSARNVTHINFFSEFIS